MLMCEKEIVQNKDEWEGGFAIDYILGKATISYGYYLAVLVIFGVAWLLFRGKNKSDRAAISALAAYMFWILSLTVLSRKVHKGVRYELIPFWSYRDYFAGLDDELLPQIIANVGIFIPVGLLLPPATGASLKKTMVMGVCFSTIIEVIQLITRRGLFEFDDIIHNALGTLIGYGIYRLVVKIRT